MKKEDVIIAWLTLCLTVCQIQWMRAEKRAAYLQGQMDLYSAQAAYSIDRDDPAYTKPIKRGK